MDDNGEVANIVVFCRAGEKRSVSICWMLEAVLARLGYHKEAEPYHSCRRLWGRKTCAAVGCRECDVRRPEHGALVRQIMSRLHL